MKIHFLLLPLLMSTQLFAGEEQNNTNDQVDIRELVIRAMLTFSVYEQTIQDAQDAQPEKKSDKFSPTKKPIFKQKPKRQKYNRRKQTNNRIQQYRRR